MEQLYNPDQMSDDELLETFVARQPLVDKLVTMIRNQPEGAGVQHAVIVAPRGMGKTTVLLMVKLSLRDCDLNQFWTAVQFPEELYGVGDLTDFWMETIREIAHDNQDHDIAASAERLRNAYPSSDVLEEALLALLRDWCRKHSRRLVLLVDNLDLLLNQIDSEQENASLRRVLMNEGFFSIIGTAPSFFKEARGYDQPLYNFFRIEHLKPLLEEEVQDLLVRRARADGRTDLADQIMSNRGRMRAMEYFTGGNARLVLMLYALIAQSGVLEARQGLERLLDQVTPYYKAKTESLPPQQRKVIDSLARLVSERGEGASPADIAERSRLTPQIVSSQLKRLSEDGYVRAANVRGRKSYYVLTEPLYSLWHQMRFGRDARQRTEWLVSFLKNWYEPAEIKDELERLQVLRSRYLESGETYAAEAASELQQLLIYATELSNGTKIREVPGSHEWNHNTKELHPKIRKLLMAHSDRQIQNGRLRLETLDFSSGRSWLLAGRMCAVIGNVEEAIALYDEGVAIDPSFIETWFARGIAQQRLDRQELAERDFSEYLNKANLSDECIGSNLLTLLSGSTPRMEPRILQRALKLLGQVKNSQFDIPTLLSGIATKWMAEGSFWQLRTLISSEPYADRFFPVARALDFYDTRNQDLLEKLPPETRPLVEEIVAKLDAATVAKAGKAA